MNRSPAKKVWTLAVLTKCANHKGLLQQLFLSTYGWLSNLWTTPLQMIVFSHLWTHAVHRSLKVVKEVIYVLWLFWPVDDAPPGPPTPPELIEHAYIRLYMYFPYIFISVGTDPWIGSEGGAEQVLSQAASGTYYPALEGLWYPGGQSVSDLGSIKLCLLQGDHKCFCWCEALWLNFSRCSVYVTNNGWTSWFWAHICFC